MRLVWKVAIARMKQKMVQEDGVPLPIMGTISEHNLTPIMSQVCDSVVAACKVCIIKLYTA